MAEASAPDLEKLIPRPPPVQYLAVFQANMVAPESELAVSQADDFELLLTPGPVEFSYGVPMVTESPPAAGMTMGLQAVKLPPASYIVVKAKFRDVDLTTVRVSAPLLVSETVCLFDLAYPGVVSRRLFEGAVSEPGNLVFLPPGPLRLSAQPVREPKEMAQEVASRLSALEQLTSEDRERFRLASRWYRRGQQTLDMIDRLLFLWTVLEIYPAKGAKNVTRRVCELLSAQVYPDLDSEMIKEKTKLGRIEGMRGIIVHEGKSFVLPDEEDEFSDYVDRLQAVVYACLDSLAGRRSQTEGLDKYLLESAD